jgi:hypothetical protein
MAAILLLIIAMAVDITEALMGLTVGGSTLKVHLSTPITLHSIAQIVVDLVAAVEEGNGGKVLFLAVLGNRARRMCLPM